MIVSNLCGGLGNMMFQISAGYSLSIDENEEYYASFNNWNSVTKYDYKNYENTIFKNIKFLENENEIKNLKEINEIGFQYNKLPKLKNCLLNGYFQSPKYFDHNKDNILKIFNIDFKDEFSNYIFLHIRRGDYLKHSDTHPVCSLGYYQDAVKNFENEKIIILSDDIEWCKTKFKNKKFEFSNSESDIEDMSIMISCKGAIIANSTFSWWGAYLSKSEKVIAPKQWFGNLGPKNWNDIYCNNWNIL